MQSYDEPLRPDSAATNRDLKSKEIIWNFLYEAREATTYDNLLSDGSISNDDVRGGSGQSGLHMIPQIGSTYNDVDTDTDNTI